MNDLISRAAAIDRMKEMAGCAKCDNYNYVRCRVCNWGDAMNIVEEAPAVDAVPVQELRVMTIGDLYGYDMGYYERKDEELVWPVLIARGGPDSDGTVGLVRKDAFEIMADCGLINQTWRIWTEYPTNEQRKAVKWDA